MTLLEPPADSSTKSRPMIILTVAIVVIAIVTLWWTFRFYPEKRAAERFFNALVAADYAKAYELWKPGPSYTMQDFLADWGLNGYYGPVKSYEIVRESSPRGSNSVVIEARISPFSPMPDGSDQEKTRKTRLVRLWIDPKDKSISFPPD
jgi:hypothetical protein